MATVMNANQAREAILRGEATAGLTVEGSLHFYRDLKWLPEDLTVSWMYLQQPALTALPKGLRCSNLYLSTSSIADLPDDMEVDDTLDLQNCPNITRLPAGLRLHWLILRNMEGLARLPDDLEVTNSLTIQHCPLLETLPSHLRLRWLLVEYSERLPGLPDDLQADEIILRQWLTLRKLPSGLRLKSLEVSQCEQLTRLPNDLQTQQLNIHDCPRLEALPAHLELTGTLNASGCDALDRLPNGLRLIALNTRGCTRLTSLPDDLRVTQTLNLADCANLETLPAGLDVHTLNLTNCTSLRALPDDLRVTELTISGCASLTTWPSSGLPSTLRRLVMRDCPSLTEWPKSGPPTLRTLDVWGNAWIHELPPWLRSVDELNAAGCRNLERLPEKLRVASWLDLADTRLRILPPSARGFRLRWRGVAIDARSAFHPEAVNGKEILKERNAEVRRVMLERVGYEQFLRQVEAETLDEDQDAGGPRRLLRVAMGQDEPLVCLAVHDPSTGRQYLLRTPPAMTSCHQAAAWIAGFDNPDDYHPLAET